jgi:predicted DNA-binding transcriptional regulator AlpA
MEDIEEGAAPRHMITMEQVLKMVPIGKSTLKRMIKDGRFPSGRYVTPNRRFWLIEEITVWQNSLPAESRRKRRARKATKGRSDPERPA